MYNFCVFWILSHYQIYDLQIIFSHSGGYLFTLLMVSFDAKTLLILMKSALFMLLLLPILLASYPRNHCQTNVTKFSFYVLYVKHLEGKLSDIEDIEGKLRDIGLAMVSWIHFALIFVYGIR